MVETGYEDPYMILGIAFAGSGPITGVMVSVYPSIQPRDRPWEGPVAKTDSTISNTFHPARNT